MKYRTKQYFKSIRIYSTYTFVESVKLHVELFLKIEMSRHYTVLGEKNSYNILIILIETALILK
jgi:hypothetical protein